MAEQNSIYKCEICGNVVSVIEAHDGALVCCEQEMKRLVEISTEHEGKEKHVPVIERTNEGVKVKVGSIPHPMEEKHYIELIQLMDGNNVVIGKRLLPGDKPEAEFCIADNGKLSARILCNIHGLWKSKA